MTLDLNRLRVRTRRALGLLDTDPELSPTDIDEYLNQSYWEVMDKFPFREKERAGQFDTVAGVRNYEIPNPVEAVKSFAVQNPIDLQHHPLDQMNARETEYLYDEQTQARGIPKKYFLENCYVRFWPTPDAAYTIIIRKWTILADIQDSGLPIPKIWSEIVYMGAVWRASLDLGDAPKVKLFQENQVRLIASTEPRHQKEKDIDTQHAGLFVIGGRGDVGHWQDPSTVFHGNRTT